MTDAPSDDSAPVSHWWVGAVGYQVYLRSFHDASGDGVGDLEGLRRKLSYVADLGVDYIWITPFYPSPQADHGYDVADYTGVDPAYGALDDFDAVVRDAHDVGLHVVIDIVPNHTSDQHPWFVAARGSRDAAIRDYYVWRDPAPDGGPPNNWVSKFGGPAWTYDDTTRQYYMHTFLPEQPDLNWANPRVRVEFDDILRFWLDRRVDGFRVDTAHLLTEDPHFRDNPRHTVPGPDADPETIYESFDHLYDLDQPDVVDVYRRWHRIVAPYDAMLLGEVYLLDPADVQRYVVDDALDLAFHFPTMKVRWDGEDIRAGLAGAAAFDRQRFVWPLSSHDDPRATHRFGGGDLGVRRSLAFLTLLVGLPGGVCLLQGDELGLHARDLPPSDLRDPVAVRNPGAVGRDLSRTPMPWKPGPAYGFTTGRPWMSFPRDTYGSGTVAVQLEQPHSTLQRTRRLLQVRAATADLCGRAPLRWITARGPVVAYQRGETVVALNTDATPSVLDLPAGCQVRYASADATTTAATGVTLPADTAAIIAVPEQNRSG